MITGVVTVAPIAFLAVAMWQTWNENLHWYDLVVFAITYIPIGFGVTIGFHRCLTHRSFKTGSFPARRCLLRSDRRPSRASNLLGRRPPKAPRFL